MGRQAIFWDHGASQIDLLDDPEQVAITGWWFFATPLKNMSSSIGMMIIPNWMGK